MNVSELIGHLSRLEPEAEVSLFWDGEPRGGVEGIYKVAGLPPGKHEVVLVGDWSIYFAQVERKHDIVFDALPYPKNK